MRLLSISPLLRTALALIVTAGFSGFAASATAPQQDEVAGGQAISVENADQVKVGEDAVYSVIVQNWGTAPLAEVVIATDRGSAECEQHYLASGQELSCEIRTEVTQHDIDTGGLEVRATTTARTPTGETFHFDDAAAHTAIDAAPAATLTVDSDRRTRARVGDVAHLTIHFANTGNVTLHDVTVRPTGGEALPCDGTTVGPGESVTCVASMVFDDALLGEWSQSFVASGETPNSATVDAAGASPELTIVSMPGGRQSAARISGSLFLAVAALVIGGILAALRRRAAITDRE